MEELLVEPVDAGVSHFLQEEGALWQVREYAAHRSLYHLKEADPHAWVLPRLWGRAKAGMAAVEFDEEPSLPVVRHQPPPADQDHGHLGVAAAPGERAEIDFTATLLQLRSLGHWVVAAYTDR